MASAVCFASAVTVPSICLPEIGDELSLDLAGKGFIVTLRMASLLGALLLCGWLGQSRPKAPFLSAGVVLTALGMAATALAPGHAALLAAQAAVGLGLGTFNGLMLALVSELHPRDAGGPLNAVNGVGAVGLVVAAVASGELLHSGYSWRATFWPWVLVGFVTAVLFATRGYPATGPAGQAGATTAFLRRPLFWVLAAGMVIGGGSEAGMTTWGSNFMQSEFNSTPRVGALTVAFFGAFLALGRFAGMVVLRRVAAPLLVAGSALAGAASAAGLCHARSAPAAWCLFALCGLFVACFWPTLLAIAVARNPGGSTAMVSLLAAAGIGGSAVFPWAIGALGDRVGLRGGLAILPLSLVVLALLLLGVWRRRSRATRRSGE